MATSCVSPRQLLDRELPPPDGVPPLYVHQTWKTCELPFAQAKWRERCRHVLPNTTRFFLWTDAHLRDLIAAEYPLHQGVYDSYDTHIKRVDASRLFVLFRFGGLYMDLDFTCIRPPARLFVDGQVTLLPQTRAFSDKEHISNASATEVHMSPTGSFGTALLPHELLETLCALTCTAPHASGGWQHQLVIRSLRMPSPRCRCKLGCAILSVQRARSSLRASGGRGYRALEPTRRERRAWRATTPPSRRATATAARPRTGRLYSHRRRVPSRASPRATRGMGGSMTTPKLQHRCRHAAYTSHVGHAPAQRTMAAAEAGRSSGPPWSCTTTSPLATTRRREGGMAMESLILDRS